MTILSSQNEDTVFTKWVYCLHKLKILSLQIISSVIAYTKFYKKKMIELLGTIIQNTIFLHFIYKQINNNAFYDSIQGVPGGKDLTSEECSLGQTIPI
jgi:hypothetical protein